MTETTQSTASLRTLLPRLFSRAQPSGAVDRLIKTVRTHHPKADIALALFVGIVVATYSTVFIGAPVYAHLRENEPEIKARTQRIMAARNSGA